MSSIGSRRILGVAVSVLAAVVILGVAAWMLVGNNGDSPNGSADVKIIPPVDAAAADGSNSANAPVATDPVETPTPVNIAVYVTGEVVNPGVYTVAEGVRLTGVIDLAGGPTENADLNRINLAAYVSDAAHYRIPALGETGDGSVETGAVAAVGDGTGTASQESVPTCAVPVNINTATAECLETLPGIGAVRAESIVAHREQAGPFLTAEDITSVSGIGNGIYGRIADMITAGGP